MVQTAASGVTGGWYNGEFNSWTYYGMDDPPAGADLMAWGHFTQVVWKSSEKVGCHTAKCAAGTVLAYDSWYTVCNYDPPGKFYLRTANTGLFQNERDVLTKTPGNFAGQYGANVLKPLGKSTATV